MTHTLHPLAEDYLERLDRAAAHLPRARRRELVDELEAHIVEALGPEPTEVEVRNVLDRLGAPEEIVDAEAPRPAPHALRPRMGAQEWSAVLLLPLGGFLVGVGWVAGVILLWTSRAWSTRDKVIGTLLVPGGLAVASAGWASWALRETCDYPAYVRCDDPAVTIGETVLLAATIIPIVTAIYLAKRADLNRPR